MACCLIVALTCEVVAHNEDEPVPFLERIVSISFQNEKLEVALKKISTQAGFIFSYNSSIIDGDQVVSGDFQSKTVREVLNHFFQGSVQFKSRGKYLIMSRAPAPKNDDEKLLTGYIIDEATGRRLQNVSVYDPVSLSSAVTDSYGYFQLTVDKPSGEEVKLAVRKLNYSDTVVAVIPDKRELMNIQLREHADRMTLLADSVRQKIKRFWNSKFSTTQAANIENIQDTLHRKFQFSIVPFVGTNHKLSGNVINDYSYNIYGGYSLGVEKLEIGGWFNIVRGDMKGVQFAGIFNSIGGRMTGFQLAGALNMVRDSVPGYQLAGLINLNGNSSSKLSAAGLLNVTVKNSSGLQMAGLGNATIGGQQGVHMAGLFNFSTKDSGPVQLAGLTNFTAGSFNGAQVAGLANFSIKHHHGAQVGGILNVTGKSIKGAQISGLINYATRVDGVQLGVVNITDSIRGTPIGLLSFVLKGYHKLEVSADEVFYSNVAFRTGVRQFYNIFAVGAKPNTFEQEVNEWSFGYGFGTAPRLTRTLSLNVDLTANQVVYGNEVEAINMVNKLYLGVDWQAFRYVGFTCGLTLNGYVTDATYDKYRPLFTDYTPHLIHDKTYSNDMNLKMWLGGKIGIRFL